MDLRQIIRRLRFASDLPYRVYDRLTLLLRQFLPHYPLRAVADRESTAPFFIIGSGRSGNTLLRAILAGHPELVIPPESYVLGPAIRDFRRLGFLSWTSLLRVVLGRFYFHPRFDTWELDLRSAYGDLIERADAERSLAAIFDAVYRAYGREHMPGAMRWGDKTPTNVYHLPRIDAVFPEADYIHMIRDGRDVVASYLDSGIYTAVEDAADRWSESIALIRRFQDDVARDRFFEVRYEDLVRDPAAVVRDVCQHLGVSFEPEMMEHRKRVSELGDTRADHHEGLHRPIDDRSVGSWKDRLSDVEQQVASGRLTQMLEELGYR